MRYALRSHSIGPGLRVLIAATILGCAVAQCTYAASDTGIAGVCSILGNPDKFNGQMIRVRARVLIASEDFEVAVTGCGPTALKEVWLEYGHGPKRQPTTWCCGDMVPRDPLAVVEDAEFREFHRMLTARRRSNGCPDGECYLYEVTATLTGRFESVATDSRGRCGGGFGHLGASCARLVIQRVADVSAIPSGGAPKTKKAAQTGRFITPR